MDEALARALQLTVLGMGMTFLAIVVLILFMYLMTFLTKGHAISEPDSQHDNDRGAREVDTEVGRHQMGEEKMMTSDRERRLRAAAAAVAVAVAEAAREAERPLPAAEVTCEGGWSGYVRGLHLSRRMRYDALKRRG